MDANNKLLEKAKELISEFCIEEYGEECDADFSDLSRVDIAFSSTGDTGEDVQVYIDLVKFRLVREVGGEYYDSVSYGSLKELIDSELYSLEFDVLVAI